jgi:hypothetical protein
MKNYLTCEIEKLKLKELEYNFINNFSSTTKEEFETFLKKIFHRCWYSIFIKNSERIKLF